MLKIREGFTIIELIVVSIIIGILAMIGLPQFASSLERAKGSSARLGLKQIYRAELEYSASRSGYYTSSINNLSNIALTEKYWDFSISATPSTSFTATATRTSGSHSGQTINMDNLAVIDGNWEYI
ncbi:type IV pilin protein [Candidatus Omnitrophota bacterium]